MHTPFGKVKFQSKSGQPPQLQEATLRDFSGGLNVVDSDASIKANYSKVLVNMHRDVDGGMSLRWGTHFEWDVTGVVAGSIIEQYYFNDRLINFMDSGEICTIDAAGTITAIWNDAIAALLVGAPDGWSAGLVTIDLTEFKGQVVVCNGVDKPILIDDDFSVEYLADIPTGSNVFVPIGRYVTTVADYTIIGGVAATPFEIHISAKGTSGTWAGDPDPNDALSINIGAYAPAAGGDIRGLSSFRNFLLVHFGKQTVVIELGTYDEDGNHVPKPNDTIPDYGIISHRMGVALNQDFVFADEQGVQTAKRNQFGGAMETTLLSDKIVPRFAGTTPFVQADRFKSFAVFNKLEQRIMFFLYMDTEWIIYVMSYDKTLTKVSWSTFTDWDFTCGCLSGRNRVFFAKGSKVFQYGNNVFPDEAYDADEMNTSENIWITATAYVVGDRRFHVDRVYICLVDHVSGDFDDDLAANLWEEYKGDAISFDWELPWSDINVRMKKKQVKYIGIDTDGIAAFNIDAFIDNYYKNASNEYDPIVSMEFVAGASPGYGGGDQPYGGGRRGVDERLWGFPLEFKLFKLRIHGTSRGRLLFHTITILYKRGNFHR